MSGQSLYLVTAVFGPPSSPCAVATLEIVPEAPATDTARVAGALNRDRDALIRRAAQGGLFGASVNLCAVLAGEMAAFLTTWGAKVEAGDVDRGVFLEALTSLRNPLSRLKAQGDACRQILADAITDQTTRAKTDAARQCLHVVQAQVFARGQARSVVVSMLAHQVRRLTTVGIVGLLAGERLGEGADTQPLSAADTGLLGRHGLSAEPVSLEGRTEHRALATLLGDALTERRPRLMVSAAMPEAERTRLQANLFRFASFPLPHHPLELRALPVALGLRCAVRRGIVPAG